jgi:integrase
MQHTTSRPATPLANGTQPAAKPHSDADLPEPQTADSPASNAHRPATPKGTSRKTSAGRTATYLYRKGNIFYFRYAFTPHLKMHFGRSELRVSLRTGFVKEARQQARILYTALEALLMDEKNPPSFEELRLHVIQQLETRLATYQKKKELPTAEIRNRIGLALQQILDRDDANLYTPPPGVMCSEENEFTHCSPEKWLELCFANLLKPISGSAESLRNVYYPEAILELLSAKIFRPEEITTRSCIQILNEYHKMQIQLNRIMLAREKGDYAYEKNLAPQPSAVYIVQTPANHAVSCEPHTTKPDNPPQILLSAFIERYIATKVADKHWKEHGVPTHRNRLETLKDILGDVPIQALTRASFRHFRDTLLKMPPSYKKKKQYKGKSIKQILATKPAQTYSIKTVNITVEAVASMCEWGVREGLLERNNAKSLQIKDERQDISLREPFTAHDIKQLFFSGTYTPERFKNAAYYWVPLIALYSGMRLEEICQLHCTDIVQDSDIWCIDITPTSEPDSTETKLLKNKNAQRRIPIHKKLLDLGFIDFVIHARVQGHVRIFHELKRDTGTTKYGKAVGKTFKRYVEKCRIDTTKKSFHSLRHTFSHFFKLRNLHTDMFRQIFGHEIKELATRQYGGTYPATQCHDELIALLDYERM